MNYGEILAVLHDIEAAVAPETIEYEEMKLWPLIRLELWKALYDGEPKMPETKGRTASFKIFIKRAWAYLQAKLARKNIYPQADTVFLIGRNERRIRKNNRYYSQYSNSLQEITLEMGKTAVTLDMSQRLAPASETFFIGNEKADFSLNRIGKKPEIAGWDAFERYLAERYPKLSIRKESIVKSAEAVLGYQNIFERILRKIRPKACFLVCWYHPATMGYIRAARKLGIPAVDIQHGEQHPMYRGWSAVPKGGYDTMPSVFWCWGEESAREINRWSESIHPEHKAFSNGNPWMSKLIGAKARKTDGLIEVLIALPNKEYPFQHLFAAIKKAPKNVHWQIGIHPAKMRDKAFRDKLQKSLDETGNQNIDIQDDKVSNFYDLLSRADFLITPWSTAVYEALAFGVRPILIDAGNKAVFQNYLDKDLFSLALTAEEILAIIARDPARFNYKEETPYMETDREKMKRAIADLMKG